LWLRGRIAGLFHRCKIHNLLVVSAVFVRTVVCGADNVVELGLGSGFNIHCDIHQFPAKLGQMGLGFRKAIPINYPTKEKWAGRQILTDGLDFPEIVWNFPAEDFDFGRSEGAEICGSFRLKKTLSRLIQSAHELGFCRFSWLTSRHEIEIVEHFKRWS